MKLVRGIIGNKHDDFFLPHFTLPSCSDATLAFILSQAIVSSHRLCTCSPHCVPKLLPGLAPL